jgi:DNA-binding transcriptional ArsR family regulator
MEKGRPQGPRDVMRDLTLSSPSVAYRHLQKLENLGLIEKDSYGQYVVREKINIKGYLWVGRNLVPRLIFYSFFFTGIFIAEIFIIAVQLSEAQTPAFDFLFFTITTAVTMMIFLFEGTKLLRIRRP